MDTSTFWEMIEAARSAANGNIEKQTELLVETLSRESNEAIIEFDRILREVHGKAYRSNLFDACDFLCCFCSDEDFIDFRAWLIAQGKEVFEKALENPDSLADIVDVEHRLDVIYEIFSYVGTYAYRRKNGEEAEMPWAPVERPEFIGDMHEKEEYPRLFPALMKKFGDCDEWKEKYG